MTRGMVQVFFLVVAFGGGCTGGGTGPGDGDGDGIGDGDGDGDGDGSGSLGPMWMCEATDRGCVDENTGCGACAPCWDGDCVGGSCVPSTPDIAFISLEVDQGAPLVSDAYHDDWIAGYPLLLRADIVPLAGAQEDLMVRLSDEQGTDYGDFDLIGGAFHFDLSWEKANLLRPTPVGSVLGARRRFKVIAEQAGVGRSVTEFEMFIRCPTLLDWGEEELLRPHWADVFSSGRCDPWVHDDEHWADSVTFLPPGPDGGARIAFADAYEEEAIRISHTGRFDDPDAEIVPGHTGHQYSNARAVWNNEHEYLVFDVITDDIYQGTSGAAFTHRVRIPGAPWDELVFIADAHDDGSGLTMLPDGDAAVLFVEERNSWVDVFVHRLGKDGTWTTLAEQSEPMEWVLRSDQNLVVLNDRLVWRHPDRSAAAFVSVPVDGNGPLEIHPVTGMDEPAWDDFALAKNPADGTLEMALHPEIIRFDPVEFSVLGRRVYCGPDGPSYHAVPQLRIVQDGPDVVRSLVLVHDTVSGVEGGLYEWGTVWHLTQRNDEGWRTEAMFEDAVFAGPEALSRRTFNTARVGYDGDDNAYYAWTTDDEEHIYGSAPRWRTHVVTLQNVPARFAAP